MDIKHAPTREGKPIEPLSLSSERVDWLEEIWSQAHVAPMVRRELVEIDRLARGIGAITQVMSADRQCRTLRDDFESFSYDELRPSLLDGLECGLQSLLHELDRRLERLRFP